MKLRFKDGFYNTAEIVELELYKEENGNITLWIGDSNYEQKIKVETFEDIGKVVSQYYYNNKEKLFLEGE